jgi:membrane protease YdiL (CAAX protease family)
VPGGGGLMDNVYLDHARRGANAWWRYLLAVMLGVILTIVFGAALFAVGELAHILPADTAEQIQHPDRPTMFFGVTAAIFGLLVLGFALAIRWVHHKRARDLLGAWSWRGYSLGFAVWAVVVAVTALLDFAIAPSGFKVTAGPQIGALAVMALAGLAIQTFAEEFVFRGYITQGLMLAIKRPVPAAMVSGLIFGAIHIPNGVPQAVSATVFGVVLALIAIRTGGIAFGSGLHLANNLFAAIVLVSGGDVFKGSPGLFAQDTPHLMWWGVGVSSLALMLVAYLLLRRRAAAEVRAG